MKTLAPIDDELHRLAKMSAAAEGMSLQAFIERAIRAAVEERERVARDAGREAVKAS